MRQSTLTFGVLLFMFVVFITVRGQLPAYLALFKSKKVAPKSSGGGNNIFQGEGGGFGGGGASGSWGDTSSADASSGQTVSDMFNSLETV